VRLYKRENPVFDDDSEPCCILPAASPSTKSLLDHVDQHVITLITLSLSLRAAHSALFSTVALGRRCLISTDSAQTGGGQQGTIQGGVPDPPCRRPINPMAGQFG
jgi:hypothetical protein